MDLLLFIFATYLICSLIFGAVALPYWLLKICLKATNETDAPPASSPVPGVPAMAARNPDEPERSARDSTYIRSVIEKLHADAQEAAISEGTSRSESSSPVPQTPPAVSQSAGRKEATPALPAGAAPHAAPSRPVESKAMLKPLAPPPLFPVQKPERSWAERLFTPENVRILQSLGIGIIFISAVAFVRAQIWNGASAINQLGLLALGTLICNMLGLGLRHFTQLRLTSLGFLILGQLSLLIDAYAVMVFRDPSGAALYPHSHASLWTIGFSLFAAAAWIQSRVTKETLFEAFTYFGALCAWGAAMLWRNTSLFLLPACYVPVLVLSALVTRYRLKDETVKRWTLPWWLTSGTDCSAPIFCAVLPLAAWWSGPALARDFHAHALAMMTLAAVLLGDALRGRKGYSAHVPALLLLLLAPLATHAFGWAKYNSEVWLTALAFPGLLLAVVAEACAHFDIPDAEQRNKVWRELSQCGASSVMLALFGATAATFIGNHSWLTCAVALTGCALALGAVFLRHQAGYTWLVTGAAIIAVLQAAYLLNFKSDSMPLMLLALASVLCAVWQTIAYFWNTSHAAVGRSGRDAADALTLYAGLWLALLTLFSGAVPLVPALRLAWPALTAYALLTSIVSRGPRRRGVGVALLAFAVVPPQLATGLALGESALPMAMLSIFTAAMLAWLNASERDSSCLQAGLLGCGVTFGYGTLLALLHAAAGQEQQAGAAMMLLATSLAIMAVLMRGGLQHPGRATLAEILALLQCAGAAALIAAAQSFGGAAWPLTLAGITALLLLLGLALEAITGAILGSRAIAPAPSAFLESRTIAVSILAGMLGLFILQEHAFILPQLDVTWRAMLSLSLLALYFSFATSMQDVTANTRLRQIAAGTFNLLLLPATWLLFLKAHSTGSSWGALWFLALAPVLLAATYVLKREKQEVQASLSLSGLIVVAAGAILLAYFGNHANLAAVPSATFACVALLAFVLRHMTGAPVWTHGIGVAVAGAIFYAMRTFNDTPAWCASASNPWEMPLMAALGYFALLAGGERKLELQHPDKPTSSLVALHGLGLSLVAWAFALLQLFLYGARISAAGAGNTLRLDAFIICTAIIAPVFFSSRRLLAISAGHYLSAASMGLAYVLHIWKSHPVPWEWYTLPLAAALFVLAWSLAREDDRENSFEVSLLLGLGSAVALIPSFILGMPWQVNDLWHVLVLFLVGFAMVFGAMATRRKIPLLSASAAMLTCLIAHAIDLALNRQMMLPVAGLIAGFAVLAVATLFESRMNNNLRSAVDRAKAEARMFWISWN